MPSTAGGEHRFPQGLIKHPCLTHSFTLDVPPWTGHSGVSGRSRRKTDGPRRSFLPQPALCSSWGGPAGLRWHPAKASGSRGICWRTSYSHLDSWVHGCKYTHTHTHAIYMGFTHICIKAYKGRVQKRVRRYPRGACPPPAAPAELAQWGLQASC